MDRFNELLALLPQLQGQAIAKERAMELHTLQVDALNESIQRGLAWLEKFEKDDELSESAYQEFFVALKKFHTKIQTSPQSFYQVPESFQQEQAQLYALLDDDTIAPVDQLFFELLIGYLRFDMVIQSSSLFFKYLNEKYGKQYQFPAIETSECFFERLANVSEAAKVLYAALADCYDNGDKAFAYWQDAAEFLAMNPSLDKLTKQWFSMQSRPKDIRIVSMAQMLHFNGNGGNFEMLAPYEQLAPLAHNSLNIHGVKGDAVAKFNKIAMFAPMYVACFEYVHKTLAAYLSKQFADEPLLSLYDFGSGSTSNGVREAMCQCSCLRFELVASDVDCHNIERIWAAEFPNNCTLKEVRFDDLNGHFTVKQEDKDQYHLTSASVVLHQLFPEEKNAAIRYMLQLTKPGGLISNPDAGRALTYTQIYVLPANTDDREGSVVWSDIKDTFVESGVEGYVKIALPLKDLDYPDRHTSPYVFHLYRATLIEKSALDDIAKALEEESQENLYDLVKKHSYGHEDLREICTAVRGQ